MYQMMNLKNHVCFLWTISGFDILLLSRMKQVFFQNDSVYMIMEYVKEDLNCYLQCKKYIENPKVKWKNNIELSII